MEVLSFGKRDGGQVKVITKKEGQLTDYTL
jgi:hypothetical protein